MRLDLLINDFAWQAIHQRYLVVYEKHFRRTFIHVRDIARAIAYVIDPQICAGHKVFNVGHGSLNYTEDIVQLLRKRLEFLVHFANLAVTPTNEIMRLITHEFARLAIPLPWTLTRRSMSFCVRCRCWS